MTGFVVGLLWVAESTGRLLVGMRAHPKAHRMGWPVPVVCPPPPDWHRRGDGSTPPGPSVRQELEPAVSASPRGVLSEVPCEVWESSSGCPWREKRRRTGRRPSWDSTRLQFVRGRQQEFQRGGMFEFSGITCGARNEHFA